MIAAIVWWAAAALTTAAVAYLLLALAAVARHRPQPGPGWNVPPRVTLLKPLCGPETGLDAALTSFFEQVTDFPVHFVFGVASASDPAIDVCRTVAARFPAVRVDIVVDATERGRNPKVSNLINMARPGVGDIVVISDSDVFIAPGTLQAAIDALAAPGVGAVTTLYRARPGIAGEPVRCFGAWYLDYWDLPMQMLNARLAPLACAYGPLTAVRRDVLDAVGGLDTLADHLCDDNELGRLVHAAGYEVAFTPALAETLVNDAGPRALFAHELRWARTVRGLEPLGYKALVLTHPGPLPLLLLLYPGWLTALAAALPLLLRWAIARLVARRFGVATGLTTPGLVGLWLRDCACFGVWAAAFLVGGVDWRGQRLTLQHRGILAAAVHEPGL